MKESKLGTREKLFSKNAIARNIKDGKKMAKKSLDPYAREKYLRRRSGVDDNILWNDLDYVTADKMYFMHKCGNTQAAQCRKYIIDFLGTELSFKQTDESIYPKGDFKEIVTSEWAKFIVEAYDSIFITGVCPIEFTRSSIDNVEFVPSVLNYQSVRIQVAYLIEINDLIFRILRPSKYFQNIEESTTAELGMGDGTQNGGFSGLTATFMNHFDIFEYGKTLQKSGFEFLSNRMGQGFANNIYGRDIPGGWVLDRCAIVLHDFGYNPDIYGRLTTPLQSIIDLKESTQLNLSLMNGGAIQNSSIPLFIQSTEQPDSQANKAIVSFEAAANQAKKTKNDQKEEDMKAMAALSAKYYGQNQEYHLGSISGINGSMMKRISSSSGGSDYLGDVDLPPPVPIIPITPGYVLSGGQKRDPTIGHRFFDLDEMLRNDISSAYGIPRELLQNTGTHSQNTAVQAEFFQKTVMGWALIFKRLLTFVYNSIYGKTDKHFRITTILERKRISNDMAKRIEDDIIDDWNEAGGNMTRREIETGDFIVESESEEDSEEEESIEETDDEEERIKTKKRGREESKEKSSKKKRPHAFDPDIQSKVNSNVGENFPKENNVPLENVDINKPIEVSLSLKSVASIDLLSYMHIQNAITHEEFYIAMRQQIGYSIDDKSLKKLKAQMKEMMEMEKPQQNKPGSSAKGGSSSSSSKSKAGKSSSKKPASTQDVSMDKTLKTISKSVTKSVMKSLMSESGMEATTSEGTVGEGRGRKKDHEKARKKKIASGYKDAKESNIKRSISARGTQVANAKKGKKNREKKGV